MSEIIEKFQAPLGFRSRAFIRRRRGRAERVERLGKVRKDEMEKCRRSCWQSNLIPCEQIDNKPTICSLKLGIGTQRTVKQERIKRRIMKRLAWILSLSDVLDFVISRDSFVLHRQTKHDSLFFSRQFFRFSLSTFFLSSLFLWQQSYVIYYVISTVKSRKKWTFFPLTGGDGVANSSFFFISSVPSLSLFLYSFVKNTVFSTKKSLLCDTAKHCDILIIPNINVSSTENDSIALQRKREATKNSKKAASSRPRKAGNSRRWRYQDFNTHRKASRAK